MASVEGAPQGVLSDNIHSISYPLNSTKSIPEKQGTEVNGENMRSARQPAERSNNPLLREQILDIQQPVAQFIINSLLQVAAFAVGIAFGIYAVKSVQVGNLANSYSNRAIEQALTANQLALLAFCFSTINGNQAVSFDSICSSVVESAGSMVTSAASALFTDLPPPATSSTGVTGPPSSGSPRSSTFNVVGIAVGVTAGILAVLLGVGVFFCKARRRPNRRQHGPTPPGYPAIEESQPFLQQNGFGKWFRETFMDTKIISRTG